MIAVLPGALHQALHDPVAVLAELLAGNGILNLHGLRKFIDEFDVKRRRLKLSFRLPDLVRSRQDDAVQLMGGMDQGVAPVVIGGGKAPSTLMATPSSLAISSPFL